MCLIANRKGQNIGSDNRWYKSSSSPNPWYKATMSFQYSDTILIQAPSTNLGMTRRHSIKENHLVML